MTVFPLHPFPFYTRAVPFMLDYSYYYDVRRLGAVGLESSSPQHFTRKPCHQASYESSTPQLDSGP
eukprot:scaffold488733_cov19-Prasinocladus_malaysianus.AAC.1